MAAPTEESRYKECRERLYTVSLDYDRNKHHSGSSAGGRKGGGTRVRGVGVGGGRGSEP